MRHQNLFNNKLNNKTMEREFVSYEQAVALQELGCSVIMNYKYWRIEKNILVFYYNYDMQNLIDKGFDIECLNVYAPLKQQVFRWFREKYGIFNPQRLIFETFGGNYWLQSHDEHDQIDGYFNTYEEAENACIDKLIELAKQQDK